MRRTTDALSTFERKVKWHYLGLHVRDDPGPERIPQGTQTLRQGERNPEHFAGIAGKPPKEYFEQGKPGLAFPVADLRESGLSCAWSGEKRRCLTSARSEVRMDRLLDKAMEKVVEVQDARYDVSLNGSLVHVVGELEPNPQERLTDHVFRVTRVSTCQGSVKKT